MKRFINPIRFLAFTLIFIFPYYLIAQNKIVFSSKPLSTGGSEQKEFVWNTPIYAKINLDKPLKSYARKIDSYDLEKFKINGVYKSYISLFCVPKDENLDQRTNVEIKLFLTDSELEKNVVYIDIMPTAKDATSFYGTGFSDEIAKMGIVQYDVETEKTIGTKVEFKVYLFEELPIDSSEEKGEKNGRIVLFSGIYNTLGSFVVDYTSVSDSREIGDWKESCTIITDSINSKYKN